MCDLTARTGFVNQIIMQSLVMRCFLAVEGNGIGIAYRIKYLFN